MYTGEHAFERMVKDIGRDITTAANNAINRTAFTARSNAQKLIERRFTVRNKFTTKYVHVTPSPQYRVKQLEDITAVTGMLPQAGYMALQETGGIKKNPTGESLNIYSTQARGGLNSNVVRFNRYYKNIKPNIMRGKVMNKIARGSRKARFVARAAQAAKMHGKGFIRAKDTIFRVKSFNQKTHRFIDEPVLNLKHKSVYVPPTEWLQPAAEYALNLTGEFFRQEMDKL